MQLDLASVSSIQVVGVVEALIQNADTLFPGGRARASLRRASAESEGGRKGKGHFSIPRRKEAGGCSIFLPWGHWGKLCMARASSPGLLLALHPEVDFNVSGMFTLPAKSGLGEAVPVEEPSPEPPPASNSALPDGEV